MNQVRRQHYVNQAYLMHFCDTGERQPVLWVYPRDKEIFEKPETFTPEGRQPVSVCVVRDFYEGNDEPINRIETLLSDIEGKFERVVQDKIIQKKELDAQDKQAIANYVSTMQMRTAAMKEHIDRFYDEVIGKLEAMENAHGASNETSEYWKKSKQNQDMFVIGITTALDANIHSLTDWLIYETSSDDLHFITSDNPFCRYDFSLMNSFYGIPALSKTTEITLPVSPKFALVGNFVGLNGYVIAHHNQVEEINERTLMSTHNAFYSSRKLKPYEFKKYTDRQRQALALSELASRTATKLDSMVKLRAKQVKVARWIVNTFKIDRVLAFLLNWGFVKPESVGLQRSKDIPKQK